jgi:purine-binding chemotaxis protein CheW
MKRPGIDWEQARGRLRASERALEAALAESPERIEAAYRQRAVRLARLPGEQGPVSAGFPALVFRLAQERYAVALEEVAEALRFERCTPAPGSHAAFRGMINLRGELRAVLDLGRLLALPENRDGDSGFVLMLRRQGREIGLRVDSIEDVRQIRPEELQVPAQGKYVKGIASGALMLLSVDAVLAEVFSEGES